MVGKDALPRVGIISLYYKNYNYGGLLQAYALQKAVSKLGYHCEQISFRWTTASVESHFENSLPNVKQFADFSKSIPHSAQIYSTEDITACSDDYDIFICGSDQIWGLSLDLIPVYVRPQLALSFVPNNKVKIAYAASMGGAVTPKPSRAAIAKYVSKLDSVSVREREAVPFVSNMASTEVSHVLDPTMLLDVAEWDKVAVRPAEEGYILVYTLKLTINDRKLLSQAADRLSKKYGLKVVTISYSKEDESGPKEFVGYIKNARYVLTNSYHGTIFSILYEKPFLTFPSDNLESAYSRNVRVIDLLKTLKLSGCFVYNETDIQYIDQADYSEAREILKDMRQKSIQFLEDSLRQEKKATNNSCATYKADCPGIVESAFWNKYMTATGGIPEDVPSYSNMYLNLKNYFYKDDCYNCNSSRRPKRPFGCDYMKALLPHCDMDLLFQTHRTIKATDMLEYEKQRFDILYKLMQMSSSDLLGNNLIIYGAGLLGRLVAQAFPDKVSCYLDQFADSTLIDNLPVYRLSDAKLKQHVADDNLIIITPLRGVAKIMKDILNEFPNINEDNILPIREWGVK